MRRHSWRPSRRSIVATAVLLAVACTAVAVAWYRAEGPRVEEVGFGVGGPTRVGEPVNVGIPLTSTGGALTIRALALGGATPDVDVSWWRVDGNVIGVILGDLETRGYVPEPALGTTVTSELRQLVVSLTPRRPGTYHFSGVRVSYGSGLRKRTTELHVDVCIEATAVDEERPVGQPVDCTSTGPS